MDDRDVGVSWRAQWLVVAVCVPLISTASLAQAQPPAQGPSAHETTGLRIQRYEEGAPVPAGAMLLTRRHRGRWVTGLYIMGASYLSSGIFGSVVSSVYGGNLDGRVWVPFVGPLLYTLDEANSGRGAGAASLVFQTLGLIVFLRGVLTDEQVLVFQPHDGAHLRVDATPLDGGGLISLTLF